MPTPSTLTSLLKWPSFIQTEERLNHLLGRCSLSEREHAELQYFSYLIARIRFILDNTPEDELPTEFKKLLCEVHKLTLGTDFSYTANPDSSANLLLYDIALLVVVTEELDSCDTHMGRVLRVLVPEASPYLNPPDPAGGPSNQTLEWFFKTHLYLKLKGLPTFIPIEDVAEAVVEQGHKASEAIEILNRYADLSPGNPSHSDSTAKFSDIERSFYPHSEDTSAIVENKKAYFLVHDKNSLFSAFDDLADFLLENSTAVYQRPVAQPPGEQATRERVSEEQASERLAKKDVYPNLYRYCAIYVENDEETKNRIPASVKEELDKILLYASNYELAEQNRIGSCLHMRGQALKDAVKNNRDELMKLSETYGKSSAACCANKLKARKEELLEKIKAGTYEGREAPSISDEVFTQRIDELFLRKVNGDELETKLSRALSVGMTPDDLKQSLPIFNQLSDGAKSRLFIAVTGSLSCDGLLPLLGLISVGSLDYLINHSSVADSFARHLGRAFDGLDSLLFILKNIDLERWKALIQSPGIRKSVVGAISSGKPELDRVLAVLSEISGRDGADTIAEGLWGMLPALDFMGRGEGESIEEARRNLYVKTAKLLVRIEDKKQRLALIGHLLQDLRFINRGILEVLPELFVHIPQAEQPALFDQFLEATQRSGLVRHLGDINEILFNILNSSTMHPEINRSASVVRFLSTFIERQHIAEYLAESDFEQLLNFFAISSLLTAHDKHDVCLRAALTQLKDNLNYLRLLNSSAATVLEIEKSLAKESHKALFMSSLDSGNHSSPATRNPNERQSVTNEINCKIRGLLYADHRDQLEKRGFIFSFFKSRSTDQEHRRQMQRLNRILGLADPKAKFSALRNFHYELTAGRKTGFFGRSLETQLHLIICSLTPLMADLTHSPVCGETSPTCRV